MHPPLFVTPHGCIDRSARRAALIALWEGMDRVTLAAPLPASRRGL